MRRASLLAPSPCPLGGVARNEAGCAGAKGGWDVVSVCLAESVVWGVGWWVRCLGHLNTCCVFNPLCVCVISFRDGGCANFHIRFGDNLSQCFPLRPPQSRTQSTPLFHPPVRNHRGWRSRNCKSLVAVMGMAAWISQQISRRPLIPSKRVNFGPSLPSSYFHNQQPSISSTPFSAATT